MQGTSEGRTDTSSAVLTVESLADLEVDPRLWYVDADSGDIWTRDVLEGDSALTDQWVSEGHWLPPGDGVAPSKVLNVIVTPVSVQQSDGAYVPGFQVSWDAVPESDVLAYEVQYDLEGTTWATPFIRRVGLGNVAVTVLDGVIGGVAYDFRVRANDNESFSGAWSDTVTATASGDSDAPEIPYDVQAVSGFRAIGAVWSRAVEPDFDFFQVRYYTLTDPGTFTVIQSKASRILITGLMPPVEYGLQVRSIDRSGNVRTSDVDPTAVKYLENDEAGWSVEVTAKPSLILPEDLAVGTVVADFISTGTLDASAIVAGTLTLGGLGNTLSFQVFDQFGGTLASWTDDGLIVTDPNDNTHALWVFGDSIKFSEEYTGDPGTTTWSTAIDSRGLNASAITFGSEGGGSNRIANSGMELAAFAAAARVTKVWTVTTDWDDATSQVNLNVSGSALTMTAV